MIALRLKGLESALSVCMVDPWPGELRDRSFENQRYRASGFLWNTVYLKRSIIGALREHRQEINGGLLQHLSPLSWEHVNLTGDYLWRQHKQVERGKFRPLRPFSGSWPKYSEAVIWALLEGLGIHDVAGLVISGTPVS